MSESVTDIIVARSHQQDGLKAMVLWSVAGHVVVLALALLYSGAGGVEDPEPVMTISLGGAPGPRTGGLTQMGARAVQTRVPDTPVRPAPTPPAPVPEKMTLPNPKAAPPRPRPKPEQAPPVSTARTESTGPEPTQGSARADTGVVRGQGFGLSSAGGAGGPVQLDVTDFCCPDYLAQMATAIQSVWDQNQGIVGSTTMKVTILRDGTIQAPLIERPSGFLALDTAALRAVRLAKVPPLPAEFRNPTLTVHFRFDYQP